MRCAAWPAGVQGCTRLILRSNNTTWQHAEYIAQPCVRKRMCVCVSTGQRLQHKWSPQTSPNRQCNQLVVQQLCHRCLRDICSHGQGGACHGTALHCTAQSPVHTLPNHPHLLYLDLHPCDTNMTWVFLAQAGYAPKAKPPNINWEEILGVNVCWLRCPCTVLGTSSWPALRRQIGCKWAIDLIDGVQQGPQVFQIACTCPWVDIFWGFIVRAGCCPGVPAQCSCGSKGSRPKRVLMRQLTACPTLPQEFP